MGGEAVRLVLDASVAVKWFVQEEQRDLALKLREEHVGGSVLLSAPDIIIYEVVNALKHNPELSEIDVRNAAGSLFKLHMELHQPTIKLIEKATEYAYKYSMSIYDSVYVSLSELQNCPVATADEIFYEKTSQNKLVMLLSSDHFLEWLRIKPSS